MVLPLALASWPALAQTPVQQPGNWHYGWGWGWGWGHMIFGSLMMVLFWGGIIVAIVLAVRWIGSGSSHGATPPVPRNKALDILQERFARGEIDKEEFEERKRLLSD
jgi:putative membrane protein